MKHKVKYTSILILLLISLLIFSGCEYEDVIGLELGPKANDLVTQLVFHYFPTKSEAVKYYEDNGSEDYMLFINKDLDLKQVFNSWEGIETEDGGKIITFIADVNKTAHEKSLEFTKQYDFFAVHKKLKD